MFCASVQANERLAPGISEHLHLLPGDADQARTKGFGDCLFTRKPGCKFGYAPFAEGQLSVGVDSVKEALIPARDCTLDALNLDDIHAHADHAYGSQRLAVRIVATANGAIGEAQCSHLLGVIDIPSVKQDRLTH